MDPAAGTVYVTNVSDGTVSVINEATNAVTATIPVGYGPYGVAVDPAAGTVYVTNDGDGTVSVINAADPHRDRHHPRRLRPGRGGGGPRPLTPPTWPTRAMAPCR